jgi:mono/diheme cytochrome c family protein
MKRSRVVLIVGLLALGTVVAVVSLTAASAADAPFLPGITVADNFPRGCVDCHKVSGSQDLTVNGMLKKLGEHPDVTKAVTTVPTDCALCHKKGGAAPALNLVMHASHYRDPAKSYFITGYKGACLNCHTLNAKTGEMKVKSGPKNW